MRSAFATDGPGPQPNASQPQVPSTARCAQRIDVAHGRESKTVGVYTVKDGLEHNAIRGLYTDRDGSVWVGTKQGGLDRITGGKIHPPRAKGLLPTTEVSSFYRDEDEALWIASSNGLFRLKDGRVARYTTDDGLSSNKIHFIDGDQKGHLWIGTANGLDRFGGGAFSSYDLQSESSSADVLALSRDREGNVWLGYRNLGLARVREGQVTSYTTKDGLADDYVCDDVDLGWSRWRCVALPGLRDRRLSHQANPSTRAAQRDPHGLRCGGPRRYRSIRDAPFAARKPIVAARLARGG
jgi:ligand-binding sensor domain-containing protein